MGVQNPAVPYAAEAGEAGLLKIILKQGKPIINHPEGAADQSALLMAVQSACICMRPGHLECIRVLTKNGERLSNEQLVQFTQDAPINQYLNPPRALRELLRKTHR